MKKIENREKYIKTLKLSAFYMSVVMLFMFSRIATADEVEDSLRQSYLEIIDYDFLANNDTLVVKRVPRSFWFGAIGGVNWDLFFGDLVLPLIDNDPDALGRTINFSTGTGYGLFFGGTVEWLPPLSDWGAILRVYAYDNRSSLSDTDPEVENNDTYYTLESDYTYLTIQPAV